MIYFVQSENGGDVKIGYTSSLRPRLNSLQVARPDRLVVLRTLDGTEFAEEWLHQRYAHLRLSGEWFKFDEEMLTVELPAELIEEPRPAVAPVPIEHPIVRPAEPTKEDISVRVARALSTRVGKGKWCTALELSRAAGVTKATVENWLSGKTVPTGAALGFMCGYFDDKFLPEVFDESFVCANQHSSPEKREKVKEIARLEAELQAML